MRKLTESEKKKERFIAEKIIKDVEKEREIKYSKLEKEKFIRDWLIASKNLYR